MRNSNLKKVGLKTTLPRTKILQILEEDPSRHLTAEDIYQIVKEKNIDISLATIYRVLTQFEVAGLVKRHNFSNGCSIFEIEHGDHHDHLICIKCGKVVEFTDKIIEDRQCEIAKDVGFSIHDHHLTIYGICKNCKS